MRSDTDAAKPEREQSAPASSTDLKDGAENAANDGPREKIKSGADPGKPEGERSASASSIDLNCDVTATDAAIDGSEKKVKFGADVEKSEGKPSASNSGNEKGDLIIRDGFPALYIPSKKDSASSDENIKLPVSFQPMVNGKEPLPRHGFWSSEDVIQFDKNTDHLQILREDCMTVFTARDKPDGAAYSAGQTFFLPANMKPRCALEAIAMKIFQEHTKDLEPGTFIPAESGANWWTLVMDDEAEESNATTAIPPLPAVAAALVTPAATAAKASEYNDEEDEGDDEVGLHFDADYELEEQTGNVLLHPRVATVTYLSDYGAPTMIFEQKSPPMDDMKKSTLENGIKKAWLSHPKVGKHTAFDGRFLHGAPALYFPPKLNNASMILGDEVKEPAAKRQKVVKDRKRYTLLVNVWLNHWVMDAALLDDEVCASLKTPWEDETSNRKGDDEYKSPFIWNKEIDLNKESPNIEKVKLSPSNVDPAGEDEIALCNHNVTVKYNPLMEECHLASFSASIVELELEYGAISLHVGEELKDDEED